MENSDQMNQESRDSDGTRSSRVAGTDIIAVAYRPGGLPLLNEFFRHRPPDLKAAFLLIQEATGPKRSEADLVGALQKEGAHGLRVQVAREGDVPSEGVLLVVPQGVSARFDEGRLHLETHDLLTDDSPHLIDDLFCSLAAASPGRVVGVLLGTKGTDGLLGLNAIREQEGLTFANEETAEDKDEPPGFIQTEAVDFLLPAREILLEASRFLNREAQKGLPSTIEISSSELDRICHLLRAKTGIDFTNYRSGTILRRINKRILVSSAETVASYLGKLESSPEELDALYRDLLINVTCFFRDERSFRALENSVFPRLVEGHSHETPLRIWVPGCSTGEEAYSIAIALKEYLKKTGASIPLTIFATDIDDQALKIARDGQYTECSVASVPEHLLKEYFERVDCHYQIKKELREVCVFARQDVIHDPPFSNLDLVSCRNLLIYFNGSLQRRVLSIFHYALKPGRFLFLGSSESVPGEMKHFLPMDKPHRIFIRSQVPTKRLEISGRGPLWDRERTWRVNGSLPPLDPTKPRDIRSEVMEIIWSRLDWIRIIVNEQMTVLFSEGPVEKVLQLPSGPTNLNVLKMARSGLGLELRAAIHKAGESRAAVRRPGIQIMGAEDVTLVDLEVIPFRSEETGENLHILLLRESRLPQAVPSSEDYDRGTSEFRRLEQELVAAKEFLQSVIGQQDAVTEELRSANEEIVSRNEELQSANEELETTKEELQAGNEELTTLNEELISRNNELSQLNAAVRDSEERYRSLTQSATDAIITIDAEGGIIVWNRGAQTLFGYAEPEILGKNVLSLLPARHHAVHQAAMRRVARSDEKEVLGRTLEIEILRRDGTEVPVEISLSQWQLEKGAYFTAIIRDISERVWIRRLQLARLEISKMLMEARSIEEVIGNSLRILSQQLGFKASSFWQLDRASGQLRWSSMWPAPAGFYEAFARDIGESGFPRETGPSGGAWDRTSAWVRDLEKEERPERRHLYASLGLRASILFPIGAGEDFFGAIEVFLGTAARPEDNILAVLMEIGSYLNHFIRRKMAEENAHKLMLELEDRIEDRTRALRESEERHRFLAQASEVLASAVDYQITLQNVAQLCIPVVADWCVVDLFSRTGVVTRAAVAHASPQKIDYARQLSAKYPPDMNAKNGPVQVWRTGRSELMAEISPEMLERSGRDPEHLRILKDLGLKSYLCVPMVVNGQVIGALTLIYSDSGRTYTVEDLRLAEDLARRSALAVDRARLLDEAQSANRAKDEFLATLSHELRTPMNVVLGWVEILKQESDSETLKTALEMMERNSRIQVKLIEDLLDISRIISGKLPVELSTINVNSLIVAAARDMDMTVRNKGLSLNLSLEEEVFVLGDSVRLHQVFQNLLGNAVKFTPRGGRILVSLLRRDAVVQVRIQDSGEGIHPEFMNHIFESFRQEDGSLARRHGGLGLGLAIAKYLVEKHGGRIEVESEGKSKGSCFTVVLPVVSGQGKVSRDNLEGAGSPKVSSANRERLKGLRILAVDDSHDILELLQIKLRKWGAQVTGAASARLATQALAESTFDLIICDIGMPEKDGIEFMTELRQKTEAEGSRMPALALTAYARKEEVAKILASGFHMHLAKPAAEEHLLQAILNLAGRS